MPQASVILDRNARGGAPDREARRAAWREYVRTDAPQGDRKARATIVRARRADDADVRWMAGLTTSVATPVHAEAGRTLADATRALLVGPELPWDARARLVALGESLGMSRFDASLVIASVQHRVQQQRPRTPGPRSTATTTAATPTAPSVGSIATWVAVALAIEVLAVAAWLAT